MDMNTDSYLVTTLLMEYQMALTDIELFEKMYPDNKDGYNYLIKVAERFRERIAMIRTVIDVDEMKLK
jgi:hypothetical protein